MERTLTLVAGTGVLLVVGLVTNLVVVVNAESDGSAVGQTCTMAGCQETATRILGNLNLTMDPCDNFYEFACGGFLASAPIPKGAMSIDYFAMVTAVIEQRLKTVIEEPSSPDEAKPFTTVKDLFRACMNTTNLEGTGLEPIHEILRQFGGWPVLEGDKWKDDEFSWINSVYKLRELGYSTTYFTAVSVGTDWKNSSKYTVMLDQPTFGQSREFLIDGFDAENVQHYYNYMIDAAVILGADRQRATESLEKSLKFEIQLASIALAEEDRRNYTLLHNPMTVAELSVKYPSVNWLEYINKLLAPIIQVDANEIVVVNVPSFVSHFEQLIANTPKRVQADYLAWRVVHESAPYLTESLRKRASKLTADMNGVEPSTDPRWKECLSIVSESPLSICTNALYVRKYFKEENRQMVNQILADIRTELIKILEQSDWMDEQTKSRALGKATDMFSHVAYPVEFLDDHELEKVFSTIVANPDDYLGTYRNLSRFEFEFMIKKLRLPVNKTDWVTHGDAIVANAAYGPTDNSIQIPAGILQGVFFGDDRPQYMNYGAVGFLIGHEMTHSFDNEGRQFDKDGNVVDWWTPETAEKYLKKTRCIIDQYSNYIVPAVGGNVDGDITQGENIADNGGVKEAYLAYKEWARRNGPEPKLPGLDYTPEQMFWLSTANVWCTRYAPQSAQFELTTDVHSPERFRVIGTLSNMPEFAADFNCPLGSNMNPEHKCSVL